MNLLSIKVDHNKEFSIIGISNLNTRTVKFQGLINGIPFTQHEDFEKVRERVLAAVRINQQKELSN